MEQEQLRCRVTDLSDHDVVVVDGDATAVSMMDSRTQRILSMVNAKLSCEF